MRVLLVKMSSLGDVFHTFPALTDAMNALPDLKVDWVVEQSFSEIPVWHPAVDKVFPIRLREWRKHPIASRHEIRHFFQQINETHYDLVLDAQGLLKSVWVAKKVHAPIVGMDWSSVREPLASLFYNKKVSVDKTLHAIERLRILFSKALGYDFSTAPVSYDLNTVDWQKIKLADEAEYYVFLHGTTWDTKFWPISKWVALASELVQRGRSVVLPWGTEEEQNRSLEIKKQVDSAVQMSGQNIVVPKNKLTLNEMARLLKFASGIVSVDTGLSHVAAALDVPMVVLYRVTDPEKIGAQGRLVTHLVSPEAKNYLKSFKNTEQETSSLIGLDVDSVLKALNGLVSDD
ncbi:lipopolysaccharide heptosyltransferase I [Hydrogenovibrio kuenenii]|uniref:lipopolysaccharide heptosyltransferase I n=1 Tax=Hydrogenovibrio kuenenii TaxID=63658 RepID=UPI0004641C85|nr:lipopolysaccharide heptosyltransferase I [Hydrogenovibrio kuenenii]